MCMCTNRRQTASYQNIFSVQKLDFSSFAESEGERDDIKATKIGSASSRFEARV